MSSGHFTGASCKTTNPIFSANKIRPSFDGLFLLYEVREKIKMGFEYGENCVSNLSVGLKCPVGILSGRSHRRKTHFLRQKRFYLNPNRVAFSITIIKYIFVKGNTGIVFDFNRNQK